MTDKFYINDSNVKQVNYNGQEVNAIYYNDTLVWKKTIADYSWEELYNICKAKQNGEISEWPSTIYVGAFRTVKLSQAVLGCSEARVRIIGLDEDGPGTITFFFDGKTSSEGYFSERIYFSSSSTQSGWIDDSDARAYCQDIYNYIEAKPYIKTVSKGTCAPSTSYIANRDDEAVYNDETVFLLSEFEAGFDKNSKLSASNSSATNCEHTYGYNFPYTWFTQWDIMPKTPWLLRSSANSSSLVGYGICYINGDGESTYTHTYTAVGYLAPAFVIG